MLFMVTNEISNTAKNTNPVMVSKRIRINSALKFKKGRVLFMTNKPKKLSKIEDITAVKTSFLVILIDIPIAKNIAITTEIINNTFLF